jgi:hypothetical protein
MSSCADVNSAHELMDPRQSLAAPLSNRSSPLSTLLAAVVPWHDRESPKRHPSMSNRVPPLQHVEMAWHVLSTQP